jgi:hypothetical protein
LFTEVQKMWNMKCKIVPLTTGVLTTINDKFGGYTMKAFHRFTKNVELCVKNNK